MADLIDEFEALLSGRAAPAVPSRSLNDEFEALLSGRPAPAPQVQQPWQTPDPSTGLPPQGEAGADPALLNAAFPYRDVAHALIQGGVAGGSTLAGAPGGPLGMAAMGGMGNLAGDIAARAVLGEPAPTLGEGATSAGLGVAGAAIPPAVHTVAKGLGRMMSGTALPRQGAAALQAQEALLHQAGPLGAQIHRQIGASPGAATVLSPAEQAAWSSYNQALNQAERLAAGGSRLTETLGTAAAGGVGVGAGIIPGAATMAGALGLGAGQRRFMERALMNPNIVHSLQLRIRGLDTGSLSQRQIARRVGAELLAAMAEQGIDIGEAFGSPSEAPRGPFSSLLETEWGTRDSMTGRFAKAKAD